MLNIITIKNVSDKKLMKTLMIPTTFKRNERTYL